MGKPTKIFIVLLGIMLLFTVISRSAASFTVAQVRIAQPQARKIEHKLKYCSCKMTLCSLPRQRKTVTGTRRLPVPKRITGIRSETMRMPSGTQRKM